MIRLDQVPATWFPRHRDPPPGVAREGSRTPGAFAYFWVFLVRPALHAIDQALEASGRGPQRALDLEQITGDVLVGGCGASLGRLGDATGQVFEAGHDGGQ